MRVLIVLAIAIVVAATLRGAHADDATPVVQEPLPKIDPFKQPGEQQPPPVAEPPVVVAPVPVTPVATPVVEPVAAQPAVDPVGAAPPSAITDRAQSRNFAGSVQLDYLAMPHKDVQPETAFAGATVELSMKLAMDFGEHVTANVKVCYACHGFEVGMAYFDLRVADELAVRVGRFSPQFGSFPLRHDVANHGTADKPLAYDMGRMVRFRDWNEGVLPAPWVDNGVEVNGTHFIGQSAQIDYAVSATNGPKGDASGIDFDFTQSRSGEQYYIDNNGEPTLGARLAVTAELAATTTLTIGTSGMAGHYDPKAQLGFAIAGADATLQLGRTFFRTEYLARWTQFEVGDDPRTRLKYGPDKLGHYSDYGFKDGFDVEAEHPFGRTTLIARWDGLRRSGNELATATLGARATVLRYTAAAAIRLAGALSLKTSLERYQFSDFPDEWALHLGIAGPF